MTAQRALPAGLLLVALVAVVAHLLSVARAATDLLGELPPLDAVLELVGWRQFVVALLALVLLVGVPLALLGHLRGLNAITVAGVALVTLGAIALPADDAADPTALLGVRPGLGLAVLGPGLTLAGVALAIRPPRTAAR